MCMPTVCRQLSRCLLMLAVAMTSAYAQQQPTDVEIVGHILEPQRLSPTDERIVALGRPAGFSVQRFAEGLDKPRIAATAGDGSIYVTNREAGTVVMLRDLDNDGLADVQRIVLRLRHVHGILIDGQDVYLATIKTVYRTSREADGSLGPLRIVTAGLPDGGQHPNRTLGMSPRRELFVSVGSTCNECRDPNPENATLLRLDNERSFAPRYHDDRWDRRDRDIYASGIRNALGFGWHPVSGRMYAFDNGIDWLGDDDQSEELNEIVEDTRYGWPYVYDDDQINPHTEPVQLTSEQWAKLSEEPVGLYTPHSAPMQMTFYTGTQFPADFRDDAFSAMRGSWNRKPPSGYEVLRIRFAANGDFAGFEQFVDGFLQQTPEGRYGFFGRPVGVTVAKDGALLVNEDVNGMMYRIAYGASTATPPPQRIATQIFTAPATVRIGSPAIPDGGAIPRRYSDYGKGVSPPLRWSGVPEAAVSLVVLMEDPDAIAPLPFVHWSVINIPARRSSLPEGVKPVYAPFGDAIRQGTNSISERGYFGPRPPPGDPPHRYHFQIFALDTRLDLPDGFNRNALLKAMQGHVVAQGEFVGTFQKPQ